MSHKKLIKQLKEKNPKLSQSEIQDIVNSFIEILSEALKCGNPIELRGLGRWYFKELKENYNARNPATNELIDKPNRIKVRFRPSKNLKKIINQ